MNICHSFISFDNEKKYYIEIIFYIYFTVGWRQVFQVIRE